jgi:hypothetical protein
MTALLSVAFRNNRMRRLPIPFAFFLPFNHPGFFA